jgi:hypothetical protein
VPQLLLFIVVLLAPDISAGENVKLMPPCGGPPVPAYAQAEQPPSTDVWGEAELRRAGDASYVNRLAALCRFVAGIPTDREPPAAR